MNQLSSVSPRRFLVGKQILEFQLYEIACLRKISIHCFIGCSGRRFVILESLVGNGWVVMAPTVLVQSKGLG